jgi:phosphatidylinositol alpha-mannosyltransferase
MKIAFVIDDTLDSTDGVQQYVLTLGAWLSSQGHDVHYMSAYSKRPDQNIHSFSRLLKLRFNRNNVAIPFPASPKKLQKTLVKNQFDVLHIQMPYSPLLAQRIIALAPKKTAIVGTFHIAPHSRVVKTGNSVLGFVLKPSLRAFDAVIAVSTAAAELARDAYGLSTKVIPNTVAVDLFRVKTKPANESSKKRIVFLGRLVSRKGCAHLIEALSILKKRQVEFETIIVGDGPERQKLEKMTKKLNLEKYVSFDGKVSEERKRKILSTADIAAFPSTGGESFGIVLIEAMAAGAKVVLGGDNPGYKEVLKDTPEALFSPSDHTAFADLLDAYLMRPDKAAKIHERQQAALNQFDIGTVGPKILKIYESAIAKNRQTQHNGGKDERA